VFDTGRVIPAGAVCQNLVMRLRRLAAVLVATSLASAVALGVFDAVLSPDPLGLPEAAALTVAVLAAGAVAGGWKAVQLAASRGPAVADVWTLARLGLFAAWVALPWLQLAF
jgi:hypothetical protein